MTSYTLQVQPRKQYVLQYSNQRGPQGANGLAAIRSTVNGSQIFEVLGNEDDPLSYLTFQLVSTSTIEGLPKLEMLFNAEEGFQVTQNGMRLSLQGAAGLLLSNGPQTIGVDASGYVVSQPTAFRAASESIGAIELNAALINLVSANTGRSPINGEAITYDLTNNQLIWGAPVYDNSLDFSAPFNSMYIPLMFRKF